MSLSSYNYSIFFDFIESYLPNGFADIHADDPIMQELDKLMEEHDQFLSVINVDQVRYLYTSKGSMQMLGIESGHFNPSHLLAAIHPDDMDILFWVNSQLLKVGGEIYMNEKGTALMSYTLRLRNPSGDYDKILGQNYFFYSAVPSKTVFGIRVFTNIDWCRLKNNCSHQYVGDDITLFKYPDERLLKIAQLFSNREFEIIKMIESGLSSKEIAARLFLSVHTVNTHRSNILNKSGKAQISDLIYELKEQGML